MSALHKALERQIGVLRNRFLPDPFDPLGQYSNAEEIQDFSRAFVVLSHAELESYIEGWAKDIARATENVWKKTGRVTPPLAFLLASTGERIKIADRLGTGADDSHARLNGVITKVFHAYYKRIKDNHGIKEKNVLGLFDSLGVPASAYSSTLLPALEFLGSTRGEHAHASATVIQSPLDPETEFKRVTGVLTDLQPFDAWLVAYKRRIR